MLFVYVKEAVVALTAVSVQAVYVVPPFILYLYLNLLNVPPIAAVAIPSLTVVLFPLLVWVILGIAGYCT